VNVGRPRLRQLAGALTVASAGAGVLAHHDASSDTIDPGRRIRAVGDRADRARIVVDPAEALDAFHDQEVLRAEGELDRRRGDHWSAVDVRCHLNVV